MLATSKTDEDALTARAVALILEGRVRRLWAATGVRACSHPRTPPTACHIAQMDEAAATCTAPAVAVHRAYALYRLEKLELALATLEAAGVGAASAVTADAAADHTAGFHLRAQICYRLGRYHEAATLYDTLLSALKRGEDADPAEVDEVRLNLTAAYVAAEKAPALLTHPDFRDIFESPAKGRAAKDGYVFELLLNVACALIEAGSPSLAMRGLVAAYAVGAEELGGGDDPMSPLEVARELAPLKVQAAYLLQLARYDDAAAALYAQVLCLNVKDATLATLIHINLAAARHDGRDLVDAYKKLKQLSTTPAATAKLLKRQLVSLHYNRAVLAYLLHRWEEAAACIVNVRAAAAATAASASVLATSSAEDAVCPIRRSHGRPTTNDWRDSCRLASFRTQLTCIDPRQRQRRRCSWTLADDGGSEGDL